MGRKKKKPEDKDEDAEGDAKDADDDDDDDDDEDENTPSLIGRRVQKEFKGFGIFSGKVVSYSSSRRFYKVVYDDGDREELDIHEVGQILVDSEEKHRVSSRKRGIRDCGNDFITPKRQKREPTVKNTISIKKSNGRNYKVGPSSLSSRQRLSLGKEEDFVLKSVTRDEKVIEEEKIREEKVIVPSPLPSSRKKRKSEIIADSSTFKSQEQQKAEESSISDAECSRSDNDDDDDNCDDSGDEESSDFEMEGSKEEENDSISSSSSDESSSVVRRRKRKTNTSNVVLPELIPLPCSSCDIAISEDLVVETCAIYSVLRSFSLVLFLSPFGLDEFVAALTRQIPNNLIDSIHLVLMQALRRHLQRLSKEGHKEAKECLRQRDWNLLDNVTWPAFVLVFLATHRFGKIYGKTLSSLGLLDSEYYKVPSKTKLAVLGFLCDQVMETEEIRAVMDLRELRFTSQVRQKERNLARKGAYLSCNQESIRTDEQQATFNNNVSQMNGQLSPYIPAIDTKSIQNQMSTHTNNDECMLCGMEGNLICCDGCPAAYHSRCVGISRASLPTGDWFCPECLVEKDGGEQCKRMDGLRGGHTIGIDPYGRTFLYACGHLLVLESSSFTESSYKYYCKDDISRVLPSLDMLKPHCDKIAKAIRQLWGLPIPSTNLDASNSSQSPNPDKHVNIQDDSVLQRTNESNRGEQKESESGSVISQTKVPEKPFDASMNQDSAVVSLETVVKVDPDINVQSEPCVVNSKQMKPVIESISLEHLDESSRSATIPSTFVPEQDNDNKILKETLIDDSKPQELIPGNTDKTEGGASNSLEGTVSSIPKPLEAITPPSIGEQTKKINTQLNEFDFSEMKEKYLHYERLRNEHFQKAMSYTNRYLLGDASATAAANLTLATGDQNTPAKGVKKKKVVTTIAEQLNAFLQSPPRFSWPSMKKKLMEIPKERCGWCFSCLSGLKRGCLMNQAFGQLASGAASVPGGIKPSKSGEGHLPGVAGYLLHMEESVHSLLQGPWENLQYRKLWRRKLEQASSVAEVKHALLDFEAQLRTVALLEDWSRRLEDAPTFFLGGCSSSTLNEPFLKKATSNKRARRSGLARRRPKGRATTIGIVRWVRRGKLAHRVSGWATLPSKVVRKSGRNGGFKRIIGITYAEEEEVPKRSRQVAWRARVNAACTVAELALQVRCLDALFRWADLLSKVDVVPLENNMTDIIKPSICAKEIKGAVTLYLIPSRLIQNPGARQGISTANQVVKDLTPKLKDQEIWVDERQVPLYLLREFEERERLSLQNKVTKFSVLQKQHIEVKRQIKRDFVKVLWERAGFSTATKLVMSITCKYCKEKMVASLAVQCHLCREPFHKDCTITSYVEGSGQMKNTCCGCLKTPAKLLSANTTVVKQRSPCTVEALKDRNIVTNHDVESRKAFISQTPRPQIKVVSDGMRLSNSISRNIEKNAYEAVSWKQNEVHSRMRIENNMLLPLQMKEQVVGHPKCFICQKQYRVDQLFIKCEFCPLWFHGAVFGVTQSNANAVLGFKCHKCRKKGMPPCPYGTKSKIQKLVMEDRMLAPVYTPSQNDVALEVGDVYRAKRTPLAIAIGNHQHHTSLEEKIHFPAEVKVQSQVNPQIPIQNNNGLTMDGTPQFPQTFSGLGGVQNGVALSKPTFSFTELLSSEDDGVEQLGGFDRDFDLDGFDVFNVDALMGSISSTTVYPEAEITSEDVPRVFMDGTGSMIENINAALELKDVPCAVCCNGSIPSDLQCVGCGSVVHQECLATDSAAWSWTCHGWACDTCKGGFLDNQEDIFSGFDASGG